MHSEAFYTTMAQVLPTMLIVVMLEMAGLQRWLYRLAKHLKEEAARPDVLEQIMKSRDGLLIWGYVTGGAFVIGEAAAILPLVTGLDGGFTTACGITTLSVLLLFSLEAIFILVAGGLRFEVWER